MQVKIKNQLTQVHRKTGWLTFDKIQTMSHTETFLKGSGIPYTFFRNTIYIEMLSMLLGGALESGQWYYAAGNAKANFAARTDMAEKLLQRKPADLTTYLPKLLSA